MGLSRQFPASLLFLQKDFERKKAPKLKTNDFRPHRSFHACKKHCFCCFLYIYFCCCWLVLVDLRICTFKIFSKKKKKKKIA